MKARLHTREDSGLVLDREGRWFHDGVLIEHPKIVDAFNRGLELAADGRHVLRFGSDWAYVTVVDAPLQVRAATVDARTHAVELRLSNGAAEPLRPETLATRDGVLCCVTSTGLRARFGRAAQAALADLLDERDGRFVLLLGGRAYPLEECRPGRPLPAAGGDV